MRPSYGEGRALRGDRIHRYVIAFCPICHEERAPRPTADSAETGDGDLAALADVRRLSGWLAIRDGRVWLERGCPEHGVVRTLYDESPEILTYLERWTAPTKSHVPDREGNFGAVPLAYASGLPAMQTQHTCILVEDITEHCNLRCPTCFTDSSPALDTAVPVASVLANVDARISRESGRLDVLMLSGGEPTLHPDVETLLDELVARPIVRILVNTNGIRLGRDDALMAALARHRERVEVYLQYDGSTATASIHHRGADLRRFKDQAIDRLSAAGVFTTLTMTAALGVNDSQIGDVVMRGLETPYVGGVSIQPQFGSGRSGPVDPLDRLTHTGVLARLEAQTGGVVRWPDLTALPCSHPHCASVGYLLRDDSGVWRSLTALLGHDRLANWLELEPDTLANRFADTTLPVELRAAVKDSLLGLLSEQSSLSHPSVGDLWQRICENCDLGVATLATLASSALPGQRARLRRLLAERVTRITVKPFMDMSTMIEERLTQCCVHVGTRGQDGADQCAPFCAVQAWPELSRQRLSTSAGAPMARQQLLQVRT